MKILRGEYKKLTKEDTFARKFYCKHARLGSIRSDKKFNAKWMRKYNKALAKKELREIENDKNKS